jgi:hypothetical protein
LIAGVVTPNREARVRLTIFSSGGQQRQIDRPLIGMSLLYGSRVTLDVVDGGPVTIEPVP